MLRKFKITVEGRHYDVLVEEEHCAPASVAPQPANGVAAPAPVAQAPISPAPISLVPAPEPAPAASSAPAARPAGAGDVLAPLAGVIDSIDVRIGQTVAVGDKVAVVEAMKMKTDIFAKTAGTIAHISVKPAESVDTGQVILKIA